MSGKFIEYCLLTLCSENTQLIVPLGHNTTTISLHLDLMLAAFDFVKILYLESVVSVMIGLLDLIKIGFTDLWEPFNAVFIN